MHAEDIDFVIIGAAKSATTWLQKALQADPAVAMPDPELHYFSRFYERGHDWYFSQFPDVDGRLVGEKSNSYLDTPAAPARLHDLLPHVQLIVQLRNPVERAYSDYCMLYRRGDVGKDIDSYLDPKDKKPGRFLSGGLYSRQVEAYLERFPAERVLILFFEETIAKPGEQLARVRSFLGLPATSNQPVSQKRVKDRKEPMVGPGLRKIMAPLKPLVRPFRSTALFAAARSVFANEIAYPPLTAALRSRLVDFYASDTERLGTLVRRDLSGWLTQKGGNTPLD